MIDNRQGPTLSRSHTHTAIMSIFSNSGSDGLQKRHAMSTPKINGLLSLMCMLTCGMIGFILGSAKSNMSTMSGLNGQIESKSSMNRAAVGASRVGSNNTKVTTKSNYNNGMPGQGTTSSSSIIEELIPTNLLPVYAPQKLHFNVTRSMLRQSRPIVGNTQRLHSYLKKLRSQTCTSVLFLGGSVTAGHNGGGPTTAYPRRVIDWLNERYPCKATNGTRGMHEYKKTHASDSKHHFALWSTVTSIAEFDVVFIEFNIGDTFQDGLPHALESKGPAGDTIEYQSGWYFEVMLRRLLLLRKPDPVAIITFNADYVGRVWAKPPYYDPANARKSLFRKNNEPMKLWVSSIYEIPVFSAVIWMLPLAGKKGTDWQFNRTTNPYSTSAWHADACCHPKAGGQLILSLVIAHCIVEEEKIMLSYNEFDTADGERDFTMDAAPSMRDPLYLSPEEDGMYVGSNLTDGGVDFSDPNGEKTWKNIIVANEGWSWYADNKDKDKYGFIADGIDGGQHIAVSLSGRQHGRVEVSYVVSYENFGVSLAWLDESMDNVHKQSFCNEEAKKQKPQMPQLLTAIWDSKASVPKVEVLTERLQEGENKTLHLCLTPRSSDRKGPENKFKLLGVRVY